MSRADEIEQAIVTVGQFAQPGTPLHALMGGNVDGEFADEYWRPLVAALNDLTGAASAYASLLRSIETGEMKHAIVGNIAAFEDDMRPGLEAHNACADRIVALFREAAGDA